MRNGVSRYVFIVMGALLSLSLNACKSSSGDSAVKGSETASKVQWANQWNEQDAMVWYKTTEGSHLISWEFFLAMEQKDSEELFATRKNLAKYGWVYPEDPRYQVYQQTAELPLGFVKDKNQLNGKDYLGLNCASCHTGEIREDGKQILVHGGVTMMQIDKFLKDLRDAVIVHQNKAKYERVKARAAALPGAVSMKTFDADFKAGLAKLDSVHRASAPVIPYGPGRLDAVGSIINSVTAEFPDIPANLKSIQAPVSTPFMWKVPDMACVQTNCLATNPLTRNIGQVLGAFGSIHMKENVVIPNQIELLINKVFKNELFQSTPKIENLYRIEESLKTLQAPKWENTFGALDAAKVAKGEAIYTAQCASCHVNMKDGLGDDEQTAVNKAGKRFIKVVKVPKDDIGTDPTFLNNHAGRMAKSGIMGDVLAKLDPTVKKRPDEMLSLKLLGLTTIVISEKYFKSEEFKNIAMANQHAQTPEEAVKNTKVQWINFQVDNGDLSIPSYKARPLDGIAFSGPYLHNGSVRTLRDLLKKPEERPGKFQIGSLAFDKENVGYVDDGSFALDTSVPGNGKQGHVYGTTLSDDDKNNLLEFLKSL